MPPNASAQENASTFTGSIVASIRKSNLSFSVQPALSNMLMNAMPITSPPPQVSR